MAPLAVIDYIVVHELCHLRQNGHGKRFWSLVARVLPDYAWRRALLRREADRFRL
jgi:predicted metal-dependent hydrolase